MKRLSVASVVLILILSQLACSVLRSSGDGANDPAQATAGVSPVPATETNLPPAPVQPGAANPDEPVLINGDIPYTSPFFLDSTAEPFVMLEDQAGFVARDLQFAFALPGQTIGPVLLDDEKKLSFSLALPAVPQGTLLDVDNNAQQDTGVQIFAVAYWSNTWGGPFLEERDGRGWSSAYASTTTDPERDYEISGGTLVVWAPDAQQSFPSGFGADEKLFTEDDPTAPIPAGYNLVDLDSQPFRVYKQARARLTLVEGASTVNDYSEMDYLEAFTALFDKASREYPFTAEKKIDWPALRDELMPQAERVTNANDFYRLLRDFARLIPDGHVGVSFNAEVFYQDYGGGFGLVLDELSDGRIVAAQVLPKTPAAEAGIEPGAEIVAWDGKPVGEALKQIVPGLGPYSSQHTERIAQVDFLARVEPDTRLEVEYKNPDQAVQSVTLNAVVEYDSLFASLPGFNQDALDLPIEAETLKPSGLGYIRISTFSDDYNLMARLWERTIQDAIDNETPGLILDLRNNGGGSMGLALEFAGYFFDQEVPLYQSAYYNEVSGEFKDTQYPAILRPAPLHYSAPLVLLLGHNCVSACEGFAYAMQQQGRATIIGHTPSAGAFGEVGQGQYKFPADLTMQFPTGRSIDAAGQIVIEGAGVIPDEIVPVTLDSVLGTLDALLEQAIELLSD